MSDKRVPRMRRTGATVIRSAETRPERVSPRPYADLHVAPSEADRRLVAALRERRAAG